MQKKLSGDRTLEVLSQWLRDGNAHGLYRAAKMMAEALGEIDTMLGGDLLPEKSEVDCVRSFIEAGEVARIDGVKYKAIAQNHAMWLIGIRDFAANEIVKDAFAYDRLRETFRSAAISALAGEHVATVDDSGGVAFRIGDAR